MGTVAHRLHAGGEHIQPTVSQQVEWNNPPTRMLSRGNVTVTG
jgi:hypothetical protein